MIRQLKGEMLGAELQKVEIQYKGTRTRTASSGRDYYDMHSFTGSTGTLIIEPVYMDNPDELEAIWRKYHNIQQDLRSSSGVLHKYLVLKPPVIPGKVHRG